MSSKLLVETRGRVRWLTIIDRALALGLGEVLENECYHPQGIFRTEDFKECVSAFPEKRAATYKGH